MLVESLTKLFDDFLRFFNCPDSVNGRQLPPSVVGCDGDSRAAFPLGFGHATNYIGKGVALVGLVFPKKINRFFDSYCIYSIVMQRIEFIPLPGKE